jgi:hypothetical protein
MHALKNGWFLEFGVCGFPFNNNQLITTPNFKHQIPNQINRLSVSQKAFLFAIRTLVSCATRRIHPY